MTEKQLEDIVEKYHYGYGEYDITGVIDGVLELYNKEKQKQIDMIVYCKQCEGTGVVTDPTGACKSPYNCCGGCYKDVTCHDCKNGKVDIDLVNEYSEEFKDIETDIVTVFIDLTERGMEDVEAKRVILDLISNIITEI